MLTALSQGLTLTLKLRYRVEYTDHHSWFKSIDYCKALHRITYERRTRINSISVYGSSLTSLARVRPSCELGAKQCAALCELINYTAGFCSSGWRWRWRVVMWYGKRGEVDGKPCTSHCVWRFALSAHVVCKGVETIALSCDSSIRLPGWVWFLPWATDVFGLA